MTREQVLKHLRRQPFRPLRIHVSDGTVYEARHPDMVLVGASELVVGTDLNEEGVFTDYAFCDLDHVASIEVLARQKKSPPTSTAG